MEGSDFCRIEGAAGQRGCAALLFAHPVLRSYWRPCFFTFTHIHTQTRQECLDSKFILKIQCFDFIFSFVIDRNIQTLGNATSTPFRRDHNKP